MAGSKTIAFYPEPGAWGPTNNCAAMASELKERGHRIVFVLDASFEGQMAKRGFEERLMRMTPPPEESEGPTEDPWSEFIRAMAPEFAKPTIEQITTVTRPIWDELVGGSEYSFDRVVEIWDEVRPDVVCSDNVTGYPSVEVAGVPWVRLVSANPLEMRDPDLPPLLSGYPVSDRSQWDDFVKQYVHVHQDLLDRHNELRVRKGVEPCPPGEFNTHSPWLNMYLYPASVDYERSVPLAPTWHRLNSTVRTTEPPFKVDDVLPQRGKVIYLSLGSLGCNDLALMQRLIDAVGKTQHRVIVSMGPLHEQMRLGERMYGEPFLPQPSILPQCDLLITHGGNNTVCEGFHFGLPMIGLPLFWDQYDNAQRIDETGHGARMQTYAWTEDELLGAVEGLLADDRLHARMQEEAKQIQADPGKVKAADLIERLATTREPVTM